MAQRRMVPTGYFKDPDIMNLKQRESQLILLGLILAADDEGRGVASASLLSREVDYPIDTIEQSLQDLAANELIALYTAGRHRYYSLTKWWHWQTIPPSKRTPSKYPAPPTQGNPSDADEVQQECRQNATEVLQDAADSQTLCSETSAQVKLSKVNKREGEEQPTTPSNIVAFPVVQNPTSSTTSEKNDLSDLTQQLARVLKLPASEALERLVTEYGNDPLLSLLGQADAAREWIGDLKRNTKRQHMNLAFFRRWLCRERENALNRQKQREQQSTGTSGPQAPTPRKSLMNLEAKYQATRQRRTEKETHHG